jgi:hypothetical protein
MQSNVESTKAFGGLPPWKSQVFAPQREQIFGRTTLAWEAARDKISRRIGKNYQGWSNSFLKSALDKGALTPHVELKSP